MTHGEADEPLSRACVFCGAPVGRPCRTNRWEEYVMYGGGREHGQPHASRITPKAT